jgi:hypothetical protein
MPCRNTVSRSAGGALANDREGHVSILLAAGFAGHRLIERPYSFRRAGE